MCASLWMSEATSMVWPPLPEPPAEQVTEMKSGRASAMPPTTLRAASKVSEPFGGNISTEKGIERGANSEATDSMGLLLHLLNVAPYYTAAPTAPSAPIVRRSSPKSPSRLSDNGVRKRREARRTARIA